jgi:GntR family transcriptional regulator, transcriptional repressor for pyruvate dehydrogenase complex
MEPVRKVAIHELVVQRIRRAIHLGDYLPGDRLPSEREIAERLEVSRETVREAIKVLESEGYVVSRRGATGGLAVTALGGPVARTQARLQENQESIVHLMDFRRANECLAARLAAQLRTQDDLAQISQSIEDLKVAEDIPRFRKADARFHLAVAVASRNPYVERAIVDAREAIFLWHGNRSYDLVLHTTLSGHQKILDAIAARDPDAATAAMGEHLTVALEEIEQTLSQPLELP